MSNMNNVETIEKICYFLNADFNSELVIHQIKKLQKENEDELLSAIRLGLEIQSKLLKDNNLVIAIFEGIFSTDVSNANEERKINGFNKWIQLINYFLIAEEVPFEQLYIVLNAIILRIARFYAGNPQVITLDRYNIYTTTVKLMKGIRVDRFLQYYPLEKRYDGKKYQMKDYYSSIDYIERWKEENGDVFTKDSDIVSFLMEVLLENETLFEISCRVFDIMKYSNPNFNIIDWIYKAKDELEEKEKAEKKSKFRIVK